MRRIRAFIALPRARKRLLAEAALRLLTAWFLVRIVPFRLWSGRMGRLEQGEVRRGASPPAPLLSDLRWALRRVNRALSGRLTCLMLAMAGSRMLARRGISGTIVLGVKPGTSGPVDAAEPSAHAWLRAGEAVVVGDEERAGFVPVASYVWG